MPPITVLITYQARPERVAEATRALRRLVATVVAVLVEEWTSREAYLGPHFQTPHLQAFIAGAGELFAGPPEIRFLEPAAD
ncbi:MAG: hypothetical protein H6Q03_1531 [Acidobacteria bacterium]|nr:hypothetical protein [Acidobacteriota bacterium]